MNFLYGNAWKKAPALYQSAMHSKDIAKRCDHCGRPMTASDVEDFGTLCERCYASEYTH